LPKGEGTEESVKLSTSFEDLLTNATNNFHAHIILFICVSFFWLKSSGNVHATIDFHMLNMPHFE